MLRVVLLGVYLIFILENIYGQIKLWLCVCICVCWVSLTNLTCNYFYLTIRSWASLDSCLLWASNVKSHKLSTVTYCQISMASHCILSTKCCSMLYTTAHYVFIAINYKILLDIIYQWFINHIQSSPWYLETDQRLPNGKPVTVTILWERFERIPEL